MANKLIQWNCLGLKANFNELLLLLSGLCPSIIWLQETFLKPTDNLNIRCYTLYNHIHQTGDMASGGSSIVVNNSVPQSLIPLHTNLQAVAVELTLQKYSCMFYIFTPWGSLQYSGFRTLDNTAPEAIHYYGRF